MLTDSVIDLVFNPVYTSTSYQYNDYISINPILNTLVLSPNEGNIITRDENGYLYGSINWVEV